MKIVLLITCAGSLISAILAFFSLIWLWGALANDPAIVAMPQIINANITMWFALLLAAVSGSFRKVITLIEDEGVHRLSLLAQDVREMRTIAEQQGRRRQVPPVRSVRPPTGARHVASDWDRFPPNAQ